MNLALSVVGNCTHQQFPKLVKFFTYLFLVIRNYVLEFIDVYSDGLLS